MPARQPMENACFSFGNTALRLMLSKKKTLIDSVIVNCVCLLTINLSGIDIGILTTQLKLTSQELN